MGRTRVRDDDTVEHGDIPERPEFEELNHRICRHCGDDMDVEAGVLVICHCPGMVRELQMFEDRAKALEAERIEAQERQRLLELKELRAARRAPRPRPW